MKLKADNLGCGECRMKAAAKLRLAGTGKVSFDLADSLIIFDPQNVSRDECIKIIEKESIYIEKDYSENLVLYLDLDEQTLKELESVLQEYQPKFSMEKQSISFSGNVDQYDIEELIEIYGYHIKRIEKPF